VFFDVIGIGALNLDYIAASSQLRYIDPDIINEIKERFELGNEKPVGEDVINQIIQGSKVPFSKFLGGSSFNVIRSLSSLSADFKLGYIGVAGETYTIELNWLDAMRHANIDYQFVKNDKDHKTGICISYISEGERSLLTNPGVNTFMADFIFENFNEILNYISMAKIIHVTSFFDDRTPSVLLSLLKEAKKKNPWLKISFDPGHHWAANLTDDIKGILSISDYLFLNVREFNLLGRSGPGISDREQARVVFDLCNQSTLLIVLKKYNEIKLFYRIGVQSLEIRHSNQFLLESEIEDSTGAGDIFASGFLSSLLIPGIELKDGVELGLRLVRHKLRSAGSVSFNAFSRIMNSFLDELSNSNAGGIGTNRANSGSKSSVFIGHGRSLLYLKVQNYLMQLSIDVKLYESESRSGYHIVDILKKMVNECNFAVLVLTAEDESVDGNFRARQNVLHEIGLFQGRYGFEKVVLLIEDGVEKFSNVEGLQYIPFNGSQIEQTFHELERVLKREKFLV
jgi:sugar/nucleoside kinase (ribokinase family)